MNHLEKFENYHKRKILRELKQAGILLTEINSPVIISETSFQIRSKKHSEQCPYYAQEKPCHDIKDLNCFLCVCPEYHSDMDEGGCRINNQSGKWHSPYPYSKSGKVWDCSDCSFPHFQAHIEQYLRQNLGELRRIQDEI